LGTLFSPNIICLELGLLGPVLLSENETAAALVSCTIDLLEYSLALAIFVSSTFFFGSVFSYSCNYLINPILGQMIERRDLTKLRAFQNSKPFSFIK
jgi:hypothetical protein